MNPADKLMLKPLFWAGRSYQDLVALPHELQRMFGYAMEVVANHHGGTYRAVYTVRFAEAVYVLHVFQKKSKSGIATPRHELGLIARRLKVAAADYQQRYTEK